MSLLSLKQELHLNVSLSLNQQLALSILKMNFMQLYEFLAKEFEHNSALEGELPSLGTFPVDQITTYPTKQSLKDELLFQLHTMKPEPDFILCEYLIHCIDQRGYLTQTAAQISETLNIPINLVKEGIHLIQEFEPIGVGAYDLKECLLIQLTKLHPYDTVAKKIVESHLSDLLHKRFDILTEKTSFSVEEIKKALGHIRTLNPVPGNGWDDEQDTHFIRPDVLLFDEEEGFRIELPHQELDKMMINPYYVEQVALREQTNQGYIKEDLTRAKSILKGVKERDNTLYQITKLITSRQEEYLKWGNPLRSLKLMDIAKTLGVHESTVSRGVNGKYILYHNQMIQLSSLLCYETADGTSVDQIKQRLSFIIQKENKQKPFTDPQLLEQLKAYGLGISRRTVSKYRQELGVASAKQRKLE